MIKERSGGGGVGECGGWGGHSEEVWAADYAIVVAVAAADTDEDFVRMMESDG